MFFFTVGKSSTDSSKNEVGKNGFKFVKEKIKYIPPMLESAACILNKVHTKDMKYDLLNLPVPTKLVQLKETAIPTLLLPSQGKIICNDRTVNKLVHIIHICIVSNGKNGTNVIKTILYQKYRY